MGGVVEGILGGVAGWEVEGAKNEDNAKTLRMPSCADLKTGTGVPCPYLFGAEGAERVYLGGATGW